MKAIEELRDVWKHLPAPTHADELLLADMDKYLTELEREIERDYMKLPVDRDGVPIRVADHMEYDGDEIIVAAVTPTRAYYWTPSNDYGSTMTYKEGEKLRRYKDPLKELLSDYLQEREKIVRKLESDMITLGEAKSEEDVCDELFADRIRELMEVDR